MFFQLKYVSSAGTLIMGGGDDSAVNITSLSGFELPPRDYTQIEFAGENGVTETGRKDMPRTLTITGTIRGNQWSVQRAERIFYEDGTLYCIFGSVRRRIKCKLSAFSDMKRYGRSDLKGFTVQLQADYPYFMEYNENDVFLYKRQNMITTAFTLPCVFTSRRSEGDIINTGDKNIYPTFIIANDTGAAITGNMSVKNNTTEAQITLTGCTVNAGESLTVDLARRRIISDRQGNVTRYLSDNTPDMSMMYLVPGNNDVRFLNGNNSNLTVRAIYSAEFLTAVR